MSKVNRPISHAALKRAMGLRYVSDEGKGIHRKRRGKGFVYVDERDRVIHNKKSLQRIRDLVIPPAWKDVWICPTHHGHIQAVGRDARGRKQYRYHPKWNQVRNETKFHRMFSFGKALPRIRRRLKADLRQTGLPKEKVLATIIMLLEYTHIRVGNEEYANQNGSYGLTTFKDRHAEVHGARIEFSFRGKSAKDHAVQLRNPGLARIVQACQDIPGQHLFQYYDGEGRRHAISSTDVNAYLYEITGEDFTAKDFRTWAGTLIFIDALRRIDPCKSPNEAKRCLVELVQEVADQLRNTSTVCRKYYIHPVAIKGLLDCSIHERLERLSGTTAHMRRIPAKSLVMRLLKQAMHSSTAH